jgi:hypothetical protein
MTDMTPALQMALNSALSERAAVRSRQSLMSGGIDNKRGRCAWESYGYKDDLCFADYYKLFTRGGVAHGAVMRLVEKCWATDPIIIEGAPETKAEAPTAWEKQFNKLAKRIRLWEKFREADMRRLVGNYSCIIMQISDNKAWDQPVSRASEKQLKKLIVAWQGQIEPASWHDDPTAENFGEVKEWMYQEIAVNDGAPNQNGRSVTIHPDRVLVVGDVRDGIPFLKAGFNAAVNMEKILGGSGESFLKNSSRQLHIGFKEGVDLGAIARNAGVPVSDLHEVFDDAIKSANDGNDSGIITQGADVTTLVANVPDPEPHFSVSLQDFSASVRMPTKIVVGSQTGERASSGDLEDFNKRGQGRRVNELSCDIESALYQMTRLGMLLDLESSVVWDDLTESTLEMKLESVAKMVEANQKMLASGGLVFSVSEMREVAGYEAIAPIEPMGEDLPDDDPLADEVAE